MRIREWFVDNPVLWYHIVGQARLRLHNQTVLLVLVGGIALLAYLYLVSQIAWYGADPGSVLFFQLFLICLILPAASHALISTEYERATWESLMLTRLSAAQIVLGKLFSRCAMLLLILALFLLPIWLATQKEAWMVSWSGVWRSEWVALTWGFLLIAFSLWTSNRVRSSLGAAAFSFGALVFFLIVLPPLLLALEIESPKEELFIPYRTKWFLDPIGMVGYLNPFLAIFHLTDRYRLRRIPNDYLWGSLQGGIYLMVGLWLVFLTIRSVRTKWRK